jgi:hypothetical protein
LFALVCIGICESGASAQVTKSASISTNSCRDAVGSRVVLEYVTGAENALLLNGGPMILLDANVINHQPIQLAEFLYFSECGHHVLGHVLKAAGGDSPKLTDGSDADCWALRFLRHSAGYGASDTAIIVAGLAALRVPGYAYPQGAERANALRTCR